MSWVQMVDSVALATTARTAVSDPCVEVEGELFPTIISSSSRSVVGSGPNEPNVSSDTSTSADMKMGLVV